MTFESVRTNRQSTQTTVRVQIVKGNDEGRPVPSHKTHTISNTAQQYNSVQQDEKKKRRHRELLKESKAIKALPTKPSRTALGSTDRALQLYHHRIFF